MICTFNFAGYKEFEEFRLKKEQAGLKGLVKPFLDKQTRMTMHSDSEAAFNKIDMARIIQREGCPYAQQA